MIQETTVTEMHVLVCLSGKNLRGLVKDFFELTRLNKVFEIQ